MGNFNGSIDTDAGIGTILSHFSTEYITHVIGDSLNMKFRPFDTPMPNMVDVLERQLVAIYANSAGDYKEQVMETRNETYKEIINMICSYYNLTFIGDFDSMNPEEIHGIAHVLYDIFISRFTEYMINFFVSYIVENSDSIVVHLRMDEESIKPKEAGLYSPKNYIDPKYIIIHANVNKVIYDIAGHDIPLQCLIAHFLDPASAARIGSLLIDNNDIYKNHYACYIMDQRYSAGVLTNIKLKLQAKTQELVQI